MSNIEIRAVRVEEVRNNRNINYLLTMYQEESKIAEMPEINPNWEVYQSLEDTGALVVVGAFDGEDIVGISSVYISVMPHYSKIGARTESIFVLKEYRKYGTGKTMLEVSEQVARHFNAEYMFIGANLDGVLDKIATKNGFRHSTNIYTKVL